MPDSHPPPALLPLAVRGLTFHAEGQPLLRGIDLEIGAAGITTIMGPNGAGKSLFLRLIHGLLPPSAGTISWNGAPGDADLRRRQAMIFQRPTLLRRTVEHNIAFAVSNLGIDRQARRKRIENALATSGLKSLAKRSARRLSGGEQQRLAIARALVRQPDVFLLDEPTVSLDPAATKQIEDLIRSAHLAGIKIILVTHDIGQARRLSDDIIFIHDGRVLEQGPAQRFFEKPQSDAGRAYLEGRILL